MLGNRSSDADAAHEDCRAAVIAVSWVREPIPPFAKRESLAGAPTPAFTKGEALGDGVRIGVRVLLLLSGARMQKSLDRGRVGEFAAVTAARGSPTAMRLPVQNVPRC